MLLLVLLLPSLPSYDLPSAIRVPPKKIDSLISPLFRALQCFFITPRTILSPSLDYFLALCHQTISLTALNLAHWGPATLTSFLFLEGTEHTPFSGHLYLLSSLHVKLLLQISSWLVPHFLQGSVQMSLYQEILPCLPYM